VSWGLETVMKLPYLCWSNGMEICYRKGASDVIIPKIYKKYIKTVSSLLCEW